MRVSPANKGAHCVARKRVYSHALRRHVMRCRRYEGGRVGFRKPPQRKPNGLRCDRRKRVYSPFFRKKVLRCAKFSRPFQSYQTPPFVRAVFTPTSMPMPMPMSVTQSAVFSAPTPKRKPLLLLPPPGRQTLLLTANAASLRNRVVENRRRVIITPPEEIPPALSPQLVRRLRNQMRRLQPSTQQPVMSFPGGRPKPKKKR